MAQSGCVDKFLDECLVESEVAKRNQCIKVLRRLGDNKTQYICIFGSGYNGKRLFYELKKRFINIECFADNNPDKWGNLLEDIFCIPPVYLELEREAMLVIVAMDKGKDEVVKQLHDLGMQHVVTEKEARDKLNEIPVMMPLGCIEKIDYSSPESNYLLGRFNMMLQDTCKYYENKIEALEKRWNNEVKKNK